MNDRTCVVLDCDKPPRSGKAEACKMHYHRMYRHGSYDKTAVGSGITVSLGRRYKRMTATGHPLSDAYGRVYVHRKVLYNEIGPGPHPCHWCGTQLEWTPRGTPGSLHVDHLNDDGADNRIENLVPCCVGCNTTRALQAREEALRQAGWWSAHDTVAGLANGRPDRIAA